MWALALNQYCSQHGIAYLNDAVHKCIEHRRKVGICNLRKEFMMFAEAGWTLYAVADADSTPKWLIECQNQKIDVMSSEWLISCLIQNELLSVHKCKRFRFIPEPSQIAAGVKPVSVDD
jgi:hypothetical protein